MVNGIIEIAAAKAQQTPQQSQFNRLAFFLSHGEIVPSTVQTLQK
jgi:hypothetical protein